MSDRYNQRFLTTIQRMRIQNDDEAEIRRERARSRQDGLVLLMGKPASIEDDEAHHIASEVEPQERRY